MNINFENGITHPSPGEFEHETAFAYGVSVAKTIKSVGTKAIFVGTDGRRSGDMLKCALISGILSEGIDAVDCGVCTTGEISVVCRERNAGGILICAALERAGLNGMRFFGLDGAAFSAEQTLNLSLTANTKPETDKRVFGKLSAANIYEDYAAALGETMKLCGIDDLNGMTAAIDCANGAASEILPRLFSDCGAKVYLLNASPDGLNVNENCGITNTAALAEFVRRKGCDAGFALSADGARCLCLDETGVNCDNDRIFAAAAQYLSDIRLLKNDTAVITSSVNSGFNEFAKKSGINVRIVNCGEEHINDIFYREGLNAAALGGYAGEVKLCGLGGSKTGYFSDGILWLMFVMGLIRRKNKPLSGLAEIMDRYPQVSVDVDIPDNMREIWKNVDRLEDIIGEAKKNLSEGILAICEVPGAVIRITAEGADFECVNKTVLELAVQLKKICAEQR